MPLKKNMRPTNKEVEDFVRKYKKIPTLTDVCKEYGLNRSTCYHNWDGDSLRKFAERVMYTDENTRQQLSALDQENKFLKTELNKQHSVGALEERVLDVIGKFCPSVPKQATPKAFKFDNKKTEEDALLLISDLHFSEIVNFEAMRGLNEYDMQIATVRLQALVDATIRILKEKLKGYDIKRLNIALLGDMASGFIHDDLRETNGAPALESSIIGATILAQAVRDLAKQFDVRIWGVTGNHGRMTKKMSWKRKYNSLDWLMYKVLELELRDTPNVRCEFSKALFEVKDIRGHKYLFSHGEDIKSQGGVPWYGIERADAKMTAALMSTEPYESSFMGHFHRYGVVPRISGGSIFINGSVKGADEFSLGSIRSASPPVQLLCGIHKEKGVSFRFPINLQDATDRISEKQIRYNYAT